MITEDKLRNWLARFPRLQVLVVGDYFLDKYLVLDRRLSEVSLETGLEAYQVVDVRCSPGAAGNVAANLRALGAQVTALGILGDDGEGYALRRELAAQKIEIEPMLTLRERFTPTYIKPLMRETDGNIHELSRLDIKNRAPLPQAAEDQVVQRLRALMSQTDAVVVADQVQEANQGVITDRVREEIIRLGRECGDKVFAVDSRERIGLYRHVVIKPNRREAMRAVHPDWTGDAEQLSQEAVAACGEALFRRTERPVFLTLGAEGILVFAREGRTHVPAVPVVGEIDPVGAGDSAQAGIVLALCVGARPEEAALLGNLVASITIQQIGTTGTASPEQVWQRFREIQFKPARGARSGLGC